MPMSERDVDPSAGAGLPRTTGEFRASPDISASTAEFRAFADDQGGAADAPWAMRTPRRNVARLAAIVVGVAVVLIIIAVLVLGH
jgi:hypothetical protein